MRGDRFSVVVTQSYEEEGSGHKAYAYCAAMSDKEFTLGGKVPDTVANAVVNKGESWIGFDGRWQDWIDYLARQDVDPSKACVDNFPIKAFAVPAQKLSYGCVAGDGQSWEQGSAEGASFRLVRSEQAGDTAYHVNGVKVDGRSLEKDGFAVTAAEDGATLTLAQGTLKDLDASRHEVEVAFDDAEALTLTFTVTEAQVTPDVPSDPFPGGGAQPDRTSSDIAFVAGFPDSASTGHTYSSDTDSTSSTSVSPAKAPSVRRLGGPDRYQTMSAIVRDSFDASEACVVASGATYPDALAATGLAGALRCPVVLTTPSSLTEAAAAEIARLGVRRCYLMGGESALSPQVASQVQALGADAVRIAGDNRQETAANAMRRIREEGSRAHTVLVASGTSFADALAAGPWAWAEALPMPLTGPDGRLSDQALAEIAADPYVREVVVLGGTAAVGDVASQLPEGITCERIGGRDRYETSRLLAERATRSGLSSKDVYVASGTSFADALAAGPAAGRRGCTLLLADPDGTSLAAALVARRGNLGSVCVVGGEAAVGTPVVAAIRGAVG